ncbi:MAG: glycerol kinase GlpK [Proteobacteria bacterium]|jgi:glycerol kinase|nr:glycerol kinase GlpK [Pseudomonadota bacterium]MDA0949351.1 glycerol kinase GlpK [Pseudomonadota bacterium]MDA1083369.1 glycerol kinase GlpK [Pseudomonadota bacterium]MDC1241760.1 glycerol kinase GlpK [Gammaproteobacteria bacterium]
MSNFLAIDQGTTSSRAIIFSPNHELIRDSQEEYKLFYPNDGWVEADPSDILKTVKETLKNVLEQSSEIISCCGITNQRETTIVWSEETGEPIYPAIVWQDRRTHKLCKTLKENGHEEMVRTKTGLVIDPYFSATKIKWILDNVDGARKDAEAGKLRFGTIDCFLVNKLSKERFHLTDVTNASRTMLFNINDMQWDEDLLNLFDIPKSMLPEVRSCDSDYGTLNIDGKNIAIKGVIGDQQSALVGQRCFNHGDMKSTYGTGCFLMVNTKEKLITLDEGLLTTIGYKLNNEINYAIEGSIYSCGNIIQWLRDKMGFFKDASMSEQFLNKTGFSNNIQFLPAFNGLAAPYWNSDVRGGFYGITQDASKNDMITAAFKSICYQTRDITELLIQNNIKINSLYIDGGMTANKTFCQLLSDSLMVNILKPANIESTALGACIVAQISQGMNIEDIKSIIEDKYEPQDNLKDFLETDYRLWRNYIEKTISNIK